MMSTRLSPVALMIFAAISVAQDAPEAGSKKIPLSKVERKNKAPVSSEVLRVKLPKAAEFKLSNGLTVLLLEDHRLPLVTARLLIQGAGALDDPAELPGLANVTAAMMKEGDGHPVQQADRRRDGTPGRRDQRYCPVGIGGRECHSVRPERQSGPMAAAGHRHTAASCLSAKRIGQVETTHESAVAAAALFSVLPAAGAVRPRGVRQSSGRDYGAHSAVARQADARNAGQMAL